MRAVIVTDLGFGDSGKGTVTDALVRRLGASWVVRHNGGAQAGHTVVLEDGRFHTFSQLGAGTFVPGVRTYLSRFMVLHPGGLLEEARVLARKGVEDALERVFIDPQARVITPFHQAANRLREVLRGDARHGSCGLGVGETMHHSIEHPGEGVVAMDLLNTDVLNRKLRRIQQRYWQEFCKHRKALLQEPLGVAEMAMLEDPQACQMFLEQARCVAGCVGETRPESGTVVFEGAQGVLLDEWRGFHPYTTWSTCTFDNAMKLVREWGGQALKLGVVRSYATRHGAGPFPTEDPSLNLPEPHNRWGPWQEGFRLGWLDLPLLRYAVQACGGIDGLAVTHLDCIADGWKLATGYSQMQKVALGPFKDLEFQERLGDQLSRVRPVYRKVAETRDLLEALEELGPVLLTSCGPTARDKDWGEKLQDFAGRGIAAPSTTRELVPCTLGVVRTSWRFPHTHNGNSA